ncbi:hypothetical protein D3C86_1363890 [compost metagenome]
MNTGANHRVGSSQIRRRATTQHTPRISQHIAHAAPTVARVLRRFHPQERNALKRLVAPLLMQGQALATSAVVHTRGNDRSVPAVVLQMVNQMEVPGASGSIGLLCVMIEYPDVLH